MIVWYDLLFRRRDLEPHDNYIYLAFPRKMECWLAKSYCSTFKGWPFVYIVCKIHIDRLFELNQQTTYT